MKRVVIISILIFACVTGALLYAATLKGTSIVLTPSDVISQNKDVKRVRIAGRVSSTIPIEYDRKPRTQLRFSVFDPQMGSDSDRPEVKSLPVIYNNLKPDMFSVGRDVILEGEVRSGVLYASSLLTQCPSKYEPPIPIS